jgi:hypothetical protein
MRGQIDQHVSQAEFLDFLHAIYGPAKFFMPLRDEDVLSLIRGGGQGPRRPAWHERVFSIYDQLKSPPTKSGRMRSAVALAREQGAAIPKALLKEIDTKAAEPVSKTSQLRALLNRKNEWDKRRSHPLLPGGRRYGMTAFDLAIGVERHDFAWAIFFVAETRLQRRIIEKLNARARQIENECCE